MSNEPVTELDDGQDYIWEAILEHITYHDVSIRTLTWIRHLWCHNVSTITTFFPGITVIWRKKHWRKEHWFKNYIWKNLQFERYQSDCLLSSAGSHLGIMSFFLDVIVCQSCPNFDTLFYTELFKISILKLVFAHKHFLFVSFFGGWIANPMTQ